MFLHLLQQLQGYRVLLAAATAPDSAEVGADLWDQLFAQILQEFLGEQKWHTQLAVGSILYFD